MRYLALASDYDGTLAHDGAVDDHTLDALLRFRKSGRKLILVTGRELDDLQNIFPHLDLFHSVVAENGAVLFTPETRARRTLAAPPPARFADELRARNVHPLYLGEVIVATASTNSAVVLQAIHDLGLELSVIFNKDALMVLPSGVNKLSGLSSALAELGISERNTVGIGDAENDHAFMSHCECAVAVANAIPALKEAADFVTRGARGAGAVELIEEILTDDLASRPDVARKHSIFIGRGDGATLCLPAYGSTVLIAGSSGSGKSTFTMGLLESIRRENYQLCLVDPEGDYESVPGALTIGDEKHAASIDAVLQVLAAPASQVVANLVGLDIQDRPAFLRSLLPRLTELRNQTGRPHWIIIDEAHHMFPSESGPRHDTSSSELINCALITVHPDHILPAVLEHVTALLLIGKQPQDVLQCFAQTIGREPPTADTADIPPGKAWLWFPERNEFHVIDTVKPEAEHSRHKRKYAQGEMEPERSFYFKGPRGQFNLRAQNVMIFIQLAQGLDEETWRYHLERGEYSRWFRDGLKDDDLASEAEKIENSHNLNPAASRDEIVRLLEDRYTAPA